MCVYKCVCVCVCHRYSDPFSPKNVRFYEYRLFSETAVARTDAVRSPTDGVYRHNVRVVSVRLIKARVVFYVDSLSEPTVCASVVRSISLFHSNLVVSTRIGMCRAERVDSCWQLYISVMIILPNGQREINVESDCEFECNNL